MSARLHRRALPLVGVLLVASLCLGCASELLVGAPSSLTRLDPARLGRIAPTSVTLGPVVDAPPLDAPVGTRGSAPFQPGGPIFLTEDAGTILRRTVAETLVRAGHRIVADGASAHVAARLAEFSVEAPRTGAGWDVQVRVRLQLRVSTRAGAADYEEISALAERSLRTPWRPGISTVEQVLRGCLDDLATLLASREELAAALVKHGRAGGAR